MRLRLTGAVLAALALVSCTESRVVNPPEPSHADVARLYTTSSAVRVSEIHYDNTGTDTGEAIEISGPAGQNLTGWKLVLYNGNGGATYGTTNLTQTLPATCGARGVITITYASNGIQNGGTSTTGTTDPDGWALVDATGAVVEFMSYEGVFTATNGPALGLTSTDIGVRQVGTEAIGSSLSRDAAGVWSATQPAGTNTFGQCNDNGEQPEVGEVATVTVTPATAVILVDGSALFGATARDENDQVVTDASFTWSSSDTDVATVDANSGLVTAVAPGTAEITATAGNGVAGSGSVTVNEPQVGGDVFISEIHYDNDGGDTGEAIEVEGPAGQDLTGWQVVLYNGSGGGTYSTRSLTGTIPDLCDGRGVVVVTYASNGIQNGSPDGMALVDAGGTVVEFISYEGVMTATNGPASGMTSTDIGVFQPDNTPVGQSLQRDATGTWQAPATATFGACNSAPPPPPPPAAPIVINELMGDPHNAESASWGEWFEVHNTSDAAIDLAGWTIATGGSSQPDHVIGSSVIVPAGGYAVLGRGWDPSRNGGVTLDYNYFNGSSTIWLDNADFLELRDGSGALVDRVQWSSGTLVRGSTRSLRDASTDNLDADGANWGYPTTTFGDGDYGTPGAANGELSDTPAEIPNSISFSGRSSSDPALPVGFEAQVFATLRDGTGATVPGTTFTWTSETPALASVDGDGVIRALGAGTAVVRATAPDGTTATFSQATIVATASTTAQYEGNAEFGEPEDGDASDDFLIRRDGYTASWSSLRGTSNWVSYNLDASHFGSEDRCNCFTFDPELTSTSYTTADYTGAGAYHGYGIDRGHLARSFDRTTGTLDNAQTYYFSNIIPQAADNNQGPWSALETYLGDLARFQDREVYIIAGVAGNIGTVKDEGVIVIPENTWKVAVIMPRDHGLEDVQAVEDVEVVAVIMPNMSGIRSVPWQDYVTTVDAVEALSGYDVLALLPDHIEIAVESNTSAPVAQLDAPATSLQGETIALSAAGSTDADGDALTYAWTLGDGATATGAEVTHTYADAGTFTVRLIVTDTRTLADTVFATVTVQSRTAAVSDVIAMVDQLVADGTLSTGLGNSLRAKLNAAITRLTAGNTAAAVNSLNAFIAQVTSLEAEGVLSAADAEALRAAAQRIIDSV
ncbi:MAG TPA: DNA/RNA non-specific endonuclease [Longimicrobiales bacterium]|nr:DNA/RNA non-specific endonuclease [Longimicrobiales bacterium]